MRLRRVEIANFRKLAGRLVLDGLGDGLVLVSGQNEEGKSTVLAALKAAFFEHHTVTGKVREEMAPHLGGVPEVAVTFERGGATYDLRKAFRRGGVQLACNGRSCSDDAAERLLMELLRFQRRTAREPQPENAGLQGLFWVDQATTFRGFEAVAGARDRLTAAVAAEVGAVAGGDRAQRLAEVARDRAAAFFTPRTRVETGELRRAGERLRALDAEREALAVRRADYEGRVDRLARLRDERRRFVERDELGAAQAKLREVERRLTELAELEGRTRLAVESRKAAAAEQARLDALLKARRDLVVEVERAAAAAGELAARVSEAQSEVDATQAGVEARRTAAAAAAEAARLAGRTADGLRDRLTVARLGAELAQLEAAHARVEGAQAAAMRAGAAVQASAASKEAVLEVRRLAAARDEAAVRIEASATRLELHPTRGKRVLLEGASVPLGEPLRVTARTELELEGFGRIIVAPGGEDLARRREALQAAETALATALAGLGVATLPEAELALERRRAAEEERRRSVGEAQNLLDTFRVRSAADLAARIEERRAEMARLAGALEPAAAAVDEAELTPAARRAEEGRAEAQAAAERAADDLRAAETRAVAAATGATRLEGERKAAARLARDDAERLALARKATPDADLEVAATEINERRRRAEDEHEALQRSLLAADPDGLRERRELARRQCQALEAERQRLDREVRDLEVALREAGAEGWGERLAELEGETQAVRAEHARLERLGRAWLLLHERLQAADQAARDLLVAPVVERLVPLLKSVFPGAEPVLDAERLALTHLRREGVDERFESLSVGTREQLAVLVRLAFARLLREREGEASCVILDDALVYADEARFETMKTILARAAKDLQILILTCRPRDYFGLDACHLRLEDCRTD